MGLSNANPANENSEGTASSSGVGGVGGHSRAPEMAALSVRSTGSAQMKGLPTTDATDEGTEIPAPAWRLAASLQG